MNATVPTAAIDPHRFRPLRPVLRLVLVCLVLAGIWLGSLPWLARRPAVAAQLKWLEQQRIDPSAMYYTELESMEPILDRLNARARGQRQ